MDTELLKNSITKNNYTKENPYASTHWLLVSSGIGRNGLPAYWSPLRDAYLRSIMYSEYHDFWAEAVGIAITKMASLSWGIEGTQPRIRNYFQQMYLDADGGQSWVSFIARHLQDFLCTDNGAFVEIVRASSAAGSRILGLMHLDSLRCTRTGDSEIPIIYRDLLGYEHEVQAHQVMMFSDMPHPSASLHGVGFCATSRAWGAIKKLEAIEKYIYEKVSGDRVLSLDLVKGIAPDSVRQATMYAREDREQQNSVKQTQQGNASSQGAFSYMGSVVLPVLDDTPLDHKRINFAELPDGFEYSEQFDKCVLQYANAIGMDVQDLQPLTGRALGTGAQSQVLDEKSKGKGLASWRQQWMHLNNQLVLPETVTFAFSEKDLRDQKAKADLFSSESNALKTAIDSGMLTPAQGTQILADDDFIPAEFVPEDTTPQETITDDEKPQAEAQAQNNAQTQTPANEPAPQPQDVTAKELAHQEQTARFHAALAEFRLAQKESPAQPQAMNIPVTINVPPPTVNITQPPMTVNNTMPAITVNPTPIDVHNHNEIAIPTQKEIAQPAPIVNVTVDVPKQETPTVNNTITVTPNVTIAEQDITTEVIERDALGRIAKIIKSIATRIKTD